MRVCFLDPLEDRIKEFPGRYLAEHQISYANGRPADVPADTEVLITWSVLLDRDLVDRMTDLKLVQRIGYVRGGGDLQAAVDRGVAVAVWPHGVLNRVAMHTLMFMLALSRQRLPGPPGGSVGHGDPVLQADAALAGAGGVLRGRVRAARRPAAAVGLRGDL